MKKHLSVLAGRLKQARKDQNITQSTLADRAGISLSAIRKIETGARWPENATLEALAGALGVDAETLLAPKVIEKTDLVALEELRLRLRAYEERIRSLEGKLGKVPEDILRGILEATEKDLGVVRSILQRKKGSS